MFDDFEREKLKVEAALADADRIRHLYLKERQQFEAVLLPARKISPIGKG